MICRSLNSDPPNVSLEATGEAAPLASDGAGVRGGNSWLVGWPRRLSSRLLGGAFLDLE